MKTHLSVLSISLTLLLSLASFKISASTSNTQTFKRYVTNTSCRYQCAKGIRNAVLKKFFDSATYLEPEKITNTTWAFLIDFKLHSSKKRGHLLNLKTGKVYSYIVAHGINSDPNRDGYATHFSNTSGSYQSSLGLYTTAETYYGSFGYSMRLDGLEHTNDRARSRAIVMHPTSMSDPEFIAKYGLAGFSRGCPAVGTKVSKQLIDLLKGGSLYYISK